MSPQWLFGYGRDSAAFGAVFVMIGAVEILSGTYKWFLIGWRHNRTTRHLIEREGIEGTREHFVLWGVVCMSVGMSVFLNGLTGLNPIAAGVVSLLVFGSIAKVLYSLSSARYDARLTRR